MYDNTAIFSTHRDNTFGIFATEYFPQVYEDLGINRESNITDFLELKNFIEKGLNFTNFVPEVLQEIVSNNIHSLAIQYQIFWASSILNVLSSNRGVVGHYLNDFSSVNYNTFFEKIVSDKSKNSVLISNHIKKASEIFFKDVPTDHLKIGSINFNNDLPLYIFLESLPDSVKNYYYYYKGGNRPIKTLHEMEIPYRSDGKSLNLKTTPKFDILTHPLVFGINCLYFYQKIYILSLNTSSDFSYVFKDFASTQFNDDYFVEAKKLLKLEVSIEDYIDEFVKKNSPVLQREANSISQILYGIYMQSKEQARLCIYKMWSNYFLQRITDNIEETLISYNNNINASLKNSNFSNFGWS